MEETISEILGLTQIKVRRTIQRLQSRRFLGRAKFVNQDLCFQCSKLDLDSILSKHHYERLVTTNLKLLPYEESKTRTCVLCTLLAAVNCWVPSSLYELRSFPNMDTYASYYRPKDELAPVMLGSLSHENVLRDCWYAGTSYRHNRCSGYICPETKTSHAEGPSFGSSWLHPDQVDFEVPKNWISYCQTNHKKCELYNRRVVSFKVIDCKNYSLVPETTDCEYLALSYVWGPRVPNSTNVGDGRSNSLPKDLPPTVSDSISVTIQLGFRYLWVDRYCIDQRDGTEKGAQIKQMDAIYQGAIATIVAVAGDDPNFGLPGAGTGCASRSPHLRAEIGGNILVSTFKDPKENIKNSRWMTRAWTLQEAILSRRLLMFTEQQLYFECAGMECCEAANYTMAPYQAPPLFQSKDHWDIIDKVEGYSKRNLTYDSDALNAFLGILKQYQESKNPVYHIWGSLILPINLYRLDEEDESFTQKPADIVHKFALGMIWTTQELTRRRENFPSWSWVAWAGEVHHYSKHESHPDCGLTRFTEAGWRVEIEVELKDGSTRSLQELQESGSLGADLPLSRYLWLSSTTVPVDIIHFPSFVTRYFQDGISVKNQDCLFCLRFHILDSHTQHKYAYIPMRLLDNSLTESSSMENCFAIMCPTRGPNDNFNLETLYPTLVIQMKGDEAERIGSFVSSEMEVFILENEKDVEASFNPLVVDLGIPPFWEFDTTRKTEYRTIRLG